MAKKYGRVNMRSQKTTFDYSKCVICKYKKDAKFINDDGVCDDCKAAQAKQEQERLEANVARLRIELENAEKALYSFYARKRSR